MGMKEPILGISVNRSENDRDLRSVRLEQLAPDRRNLPIATAGQFPGRNPETVGFRANRREQYHSEAALNQLIFGDIILLNKIDLVAPEVVIELEKYILSIAPNARVITAEGKYHYH
jgi:G3E family GTPase